MPPVPWALPGIAPHQRVAPVGAHVVWQSPVGAFVVWEFRASVTTLAGTATGKKERRSCLKISPNASLASLTG